MYTIEYYLGIKRINNAIRNNMDGFQRLSQ